MRSEKSTARTRRGRRGRQAVNEQPLYSCNNGDRCALTEEVDVTILDQGQGWSRVPVQDTTQARECRSCVIAQRVTDDGMRSVAPYVANDVDDVVISEPALDGLMVIPRQHIRGLEDLSVLGRAHLLAVLRRVTQSVQERNPGSSTRIVVTTDAPATQDHVCFHVAPSGSEESVIARSGRSP